MLMDGMMIKMARKQCPFCEKLYTPPLCICGAYAIPEGEDGNKTFKEIYGIKPSEVKL